MQGTQITVVGNLGSGVEVKKVNGQSVATVRVAETPSYYDKQRGEWVEAPTNWWAVEVWGEMADNAAASLAKGAAVLVLGNAGTQEWTDKQSGEKRSRMVLRASAIGPNLARATAQVVKTGQSGPQY
jgi:single-strand DNA-binding protein